MRDGKEMEKRRKEEKKEGNIVFAFLFIQFVLFSSF